MARVSLEDLRQRVSAALQRAGAGAAMADATARALVLAESQGLSSHGLSRVAQYSAHLRNGRADGRAVPTLLAGRGGACVVDAGEGLAFPACELAVHEAIARAAGHGVAFVGVAASHHAGVIVDHLRVAAAAGMVGLAFANSPAAMQRSAKWFSPQPTAFGSPNLGSPTWITGLPRYWVKVSPPSLL